VGRRRLRSRAAAPRRAPERADHGPVAAGAAPLAWDLILRHSGGNFFVDAPGYVFPISYEDTGSGVFGTALAAILLGVGMLQTATGRGLARAAAVCGLAAPLVDIYLY
jgi:hypothetical protein